MKRGALLAAAAGLMLALGTAWWLTRARLSDREQIARVIRQIQQGVQTKNTNLILSGISRDYRDGAGLNYRDLWRAAWRLRRGQEQVRVLIPELEMTTNPDTAWVKLRAEVSVGYSEETAKHYAGRIALALRRERGGWKVISSGGWQSWAEEWE